MPLKDFRSVHLPYCLEKQEDGSWLVLNREYLPLGFNDLTKGVNYKKLPLTIKFRGLSARVIAKAAYDGKMQNGKFFLYNDGCIPTGSAKHMKAYLARLAILAKLKRSPD